MTERLVTAASRLLANRTSRSGLLARVAVIGSAIAVGPLRYLLEPTSALGIVTCADCAPGSACCDGWTTFCCTINGGLNACPSYTFIGGWWKCTEYTGHLLCASEGVRYYLDCNRLPARSCPAGCSCANGECDHRHTCCNVFRYGQCNTQVGVVTEVVCRVISCVNPCRLYPGVCSCSELVDNRTCSHEAPCLDIPEYTGLGAGGGTIR